MSVTILSGPIGAGKTTVARELIALLAAPVAYIEGDTFWSFVTKSHSRDRREVFRVIMRAMTAAAMPFARSGYEVIVDFSIPPQFLETARKILKEVPLNYIVLRPSLAICEARAAARPEGRISDYANHREFYALFEVHSSYLVCDDEADAFTVAKRICEGLKA
ncbi:MAG TPA: AAA family ATPase, partial [Bryobacteraceae bacterium]|nr:AAA family ATPase [Bryobacteraceae bacterium]